MSNFRADCSRCCGLCCIVPAQLAVQGFPVDKPANKPCCYLNARNGCSIHGRRAQHGYEACAGFDCFGAGPWVVQTLFVGASWTDSPATAARMFAAYRLWLPRFESAALLEAALPHVRGDAQSLLSARIAVLTDATNADPALPTDGARLRRETLAFIRSLLSAS